MKNLSKHKSRAKVIEYLDMVTVVGDCLSVMIGLMLGLLVRYKIVVVEDFASRFYGGHSNSFALEDFYGYSFFGFLLFFWFLVGNKMYRKWNFLKTSRVVKPVVKSCLMWAAVFISFALVFKIEPSISRIYVVLCSFLIGSALVVWRFIFVIVMRQSKVICSIRQRVLFIGSNKESERLAYAIKSDPSHPYCIVSLDDGQGAQSKIKSDHFFSFSRNLREFSEVLSKNEVDIVVLAENVCGNSDANELANVCEKLFVEFKVIPSAFTILLSGLRLETISGVPILGLTELPISGNVGRIKKRLVDIFGSVLGIFISVPILAVLAILINWESPGPFLFHQERVGRRGRKFTMYKVRSMQLGSDQLDHKNQSTLRNDPRLLRVGAFIRKWNLDELPQFFNVLLGHMSLVGPRPERTYHSDLLSDRIPHYRARLLVKPGMTGWAQIHGLRGDTDLSERVRYDIYYLENWSTLLDFQIMFQTLLRSRNAY